MWPGGTKPMLLPESSCVCIRSVTPRVCLGKVPFLLFSHYYGNHFPDFLSPFLSWVNTYDHAKFQRNLSIGMARMIVQTYRQTSFMYISGPVAAWLHGIGAA